MFALIFMGACAAVLCFIGWAARVQPQAREEWDPISTVAHVAACHSEPLEYGPIDMEKVDLVYSPAAPTPEEAEARQHAAVLRKRKIAAQKPLSPEEAKARLRRGPLVKLPRKAAEPEAAEAPAQQSPASNIDPEVLVQEGASDEQHDPTLD